MYEHEMIGRMRVPSALVGGQGSTVIAKFGNFGFYLIFGQCRKDLLV